MLHFIGDSHSSIFSGTGQIQPIWPEPTNDTLSQFKTYRINDTVGTVYPITGYGYRKKRHLVEPIIQSINFEENDKLFFCQGELDVRAHIAKQWLLRDKDLDETVERCVSRYIKEIKYYKKYTSNIWVYGPIASHTDEKPYRVSHHTYGTNVQRNIITEKYNLALEKMCKEEGFGFITLFYKMLNDDMTTIQEYLDDFEDCYFHLHERMVPIILNKFREEKLIN